MTRRIYRFVTPALLALLAACAKPTTPQVLGPLAVDIPELCTVCVEVLRCDGGERHTLYVMDEKGAWAQVATIWDYFAQFFRPKTEDFRTLTQYEVAADTAAVKSRTADLEARLDVWSRRIELPDSVVDQKTGQWVGRNGAVMGQCAALPRGPDRQMAKMLEESP
jgi:hypothetical protein